MNRGRNGRRAIALSVWLGASALACPDTDRPVRPRDAQIAAEIVDGTHGSGNAHFFFLPPLVPEPESPVTLDASVARFLTVEICELSGDGCGHLVTRFTTESGPGSETLRHDTTESHYIANWHSDAFDLSTEATYRIRVVAAGTELGRADVDVVGSGKDLKNVDTGEYVPLIEGRTLPIRFRVQPGAVFIVGNAGGQIIAADGAVTLTIPASALDRTVGITVRPAPEVPAEPSIVQGSTHELGPDSIRLAAPARLRLVYEPARAAGDVEEASLRPHRVEDGVWVEVFESGADTASSAVFGSIQTLGVYGALAQRRVGSVEVIPDSAHLEVGSTIVLHATPRDSLGHPLKRAVAWGSTAEGVAVVDSAGGVTGRASGQAMITATAEARTGSTRVWVTNAAYPHEGPGFTRISERGFDAVAEEGWVDASLTELLSIVEDSTAPRSPPRVGRASFPRDSLGGSELGMKTFIDFSPVGYRRLYISFWFKLSENWQGHDSHVNKILYVTADESLGNPVYLAAMGRDSGPLHPEVRLQGIPIVEARNLPPNVDPTVRIQRAAWHRWELLLVMNTGDDADGEAHWWFDGRKVGEYRDVTFVDATQRPSWDAVKWSPVWGGIGDSIENDMFQWIDHLYVSGGF